MLWQRLSQQIVSKSVDFYIYIFKRHFQISWDHNVGYREHYRVSFFPGSPNAYPQVKVSSPIYDIFFHKYLFWSAQSPALISGLDTEVTINGLNGNTDYIFVVSAESYNIHSDGNYAQASTGTDWCQAQGIDKTQYILAEKKANLWPIPLFHARRPKVCIQG